MNLPVRKTILSEKKIPVKMKQFIVGVALLCLPFLTLAQDAAGDAAAGETIFKNNCAACHNVTAEKSVGPGL